MSDIQPPPDEWYERRIKMWRKLHPNAPATLACKRCRLPFPNPMFEGSNIVTVVCDDCRPVIVAGVSKGKKRSRPKPRAMSSPPPSLSPVQPQPAVAVAGALPNSLSGWGARFG
jgi:hypothetical protein